MGNDEQDPKRKGADDAALPQLPIDESNHGAGTFTGTGGAASSNKKKKIIIIAAVLVVLIAGGAFACMQLIKDKTPKGPFGVGQLGDKSEANQFSTDPAEKGKYLSFNNCKGTGSKQLGSGPMRPADIGVIEPYGLVAGGHVTPVDHQYYYGKDQKAAASTYDVLAPADGTIVSVEARPRGGSNADFRVVISYSCTFFSYFDLANSLSPEVAALMPTGYATKNGPQKVVIPVKQGQVLAKVGGQSLDFAVWDTTKTLKGLLVHDAYNNYEPWKIHTVSPMDYYTADAKAQVLPFYVGAAVPQDGKLDDDVDGTAAGSWFKKGTNGYIGAFKQTEFNPMTYADGHFSFAPDLFDPSDWVFSTGAVNHGTQYGVKKLTVVPNKLTTSSGAVKYELVQLEHVDENGARWMGTTITKTIKVGKSGSTAATALVELTGKRELKVEVFPGKTPSQVNGFSKPIVYTRGDGAKAMVNQ
jgi:hypothetical protein